MSMKANKNGKEYPLGFMPEHYPADRVYLDGDTSKTVQSMIYYEDVTVETDSNGYADIRAKAPIDKTFAVMVVGSTFRQCAELFINSANATQYYAYVHDRGETAPKVASTTVTLRIWKRL